MGGYVNCFLYNHSRCLTAPLHIYKGRHSGTLQLHSGYSSLLLMQNLIQSILYYRLVCVSVNRLTLHLRSYNSDTDSERTMAPFVAKLRRRNSWLGASTLEVSRASGSGLSTVEMNDLYHGGHGGSSDRDFHSLYDDHANSAFSM